MAWYNASWTYRAKLTFEADYIYSDISDEAYLVDLDNMPDGFWTHVLDGGGDIRVTQSDGTTELCREVVFCNTATGKGELWIKYAGSLSGTTDTDIYIYYGNAAASDYAITDAYGAENVWSDNYIAVWHFQTDGTDSTTNDNDLTNTGTGAFSAGQVAGGNAWVNNSTTANYLVISSSSTTLKNSGNSLTVLGWYWNKNEGGINQGVNNLDGSLTGGYEIQNVVWFNVSDYQFPGGYMRGDGNRDFWNKPNLDIDELWRWEGFSYDKTVPEINFKVNTVDNFGFTSNQTNTGIKSIASMRFCINIRASDLSTAHKYYARYDSIRMKSEAIADAEQQTHYANESANATFFTFGTEETGVTSAVKDIIGSGIMVYPR